RDLLARAVEPVRGAARRDDEAGGRTREHHMLGDLVELVCLGGDDAGAVRRVPNHWVLLEHEDVEPLAGQQHRAVEPRRPGADDDDVVEMSRGASTAPTGASERPLDTRSIRVGGSDAAPPDPAHRFRLAPIPGT